MDEKGNPVFTVPFEVIRPAGWQEVKDEEGNPRKDSYLITRDGAYQTLVQDGFAAEMDSLYGRRPLL